MQRMTRQRVAVLNDLAAHTGFRSAQQIHADLAAKGKRIGLTTVYRSLQTMADEGLVDTVRASDGETLFRYCELVTHHHHLVCRECGATEEVDLAEAEKILSQVAADHGYINAAHSMELYGVCPNCQVLQATQQAVGTLGSTMPAANAASEAPTDTADVANAASAAGTTSTGTEAIDDEHPTLDVSTADNECPIPTPSAPPIPTPNAK